METKAKPQRSALQHKQQTLAQALRILSCMKGQLQPLLNEIDNLNARTEPENRLHELQTDMRTLNSFVAQKLSNAKYLMELMKHEAVLRDLKKQQDKLSK